MKTVVIALAILAIVAAFDVYPTKYDHLDIDAILKNERLFNNYLDCLVNKGKCNEEGALLKEVIPDALITGCSKCNEHQKVTADKVIKYIIKHRPEYWKTLLSVYDPEGKYQDKYSQYLHPL